MPARWEIAQVIGNDREFLGVGNEDVGYLDLKIVEMLLELYTQDSEAFEAVIDIVELLLERPRLESPIDG